MIAQQARRFSYTSPRANLYIRAGYFLLHQTDLLLTVFSTSRGLFELNPFVRGALSSPGDLALFKILIPALIALVLPTKLITPAFVIIFFVNVWNLGQLLSWWL